MKKVLLILLVTVFSPKGYSQYDSTAPYLKTRTLPPFSLLSVDSVVFTQSLLEEDRNTIIMLFDPTCEHCQKQMDLLLSMKELPDYAQLVMISIDKMEENKLFYHKYHLERFPFVHLGKDFKQFFLSYYRPSTLPLLVFYNKKNELVWLKQGNANKQEILDALK